MTKKPFFNALFASTYIVALVSVMSFVGDYLQNVPDNFFMPMGMLSLLVLSVSLMAYLFFYQPLTMILEGKREKAVHFFLQTVAYFAAFTALVIATALIIGTTATAL